MTEYRKLVDRERSFLKITLVNTPELDVELVGHELFVFLAELLEVLRVGSHFVRIRLAIFTFFERRSILGLAIPFHQRGALGFAVTDERREYAPILADRKLQTDSELARLRIGGLGNLVEDVKENGSCVVFHVVLK